MKPIRTTAAAAVVLSCLALVLQVPRDGAASPRRRPDPQSSKPRTPEADRTDSPLIVHEWGTFTSFAGSDGVNLEFRPLVDNDLPPFVFNRARQSSFLLGKPNISALQRMETPVTYFYTPVERDVRVRVEFPDGLLTEYYPPVQSYSPVEASLKPDLSLHGNPKLKGSSLDWGTVHLIPREALNARVQDAGLAQRIGQHVEQTMVPAVGDFPHYGYARDTDSAIVQVRFNGKPAPLVPDMPKLDFFEKFLFYRGLGDFQLPLTMRATGESTFELTNTGNDPIRSLFLVTVRGETLWFSHADGIEGADRIELNQSTTPSSIDELANSVTAALVKAGLYEKEAQAMVKTWKESWFGEEGTRLFYILPPAVTEKLLPLTIEPHPDELVRVLVGRLEIMPPSEEREILDLVKQSLDARAARSSKDDAGFENRVIEKLHGMGRLAEPALVRASEIATDDAVREEAKNLIQALRTEITQTQNE